MKTNLFLFAALAAAFLSVSSFSAAQVTIGGGDQPKAGTILDLNSTTKGGLLLSNVELTALDAIPASFPNGSAITEPEKQALAGMVVWNANDCLVPNGDGLYIWDGSKWNYTGGGDGYTSCVTVPAPTCMPAVPAVSFLYYNLGADAAKLMSLYPDLSPAKQQMAYLTEVSSSATDSTVYGDLYQWGRFRDGHEKRDAVPYGGENSTSSIGALSGDNLDATTGQVSISTLGEAYDKTSTTQKYGHFIKPDVFSPDWRTPKMDDLWGNGKSISYNFGSADGGAVPGSSGYYQKPVRTVNDPCPSGWHVPTQDEWERLANYDCNPQTDGGNFSIATSSEYYKSLSGLTNGATNAPLTWVRVENGLASIGTWEEGDRNGYAIYETDVWNDAATAYHSGANPLYEEAAPEPLLFLPTAGWRSMSDGVKDYTGKYGDYWSSTITSSDTYIWKLRDGGVSTDYDSRGIGMSVRCVKSN